MTERRKPALTARWSKREKDLVIAYPNGPDGHLAYNVLCGPRARYDSSQNPAFPVVYDKSFTDELERRGYDLTTLKFSICRKPADPASQSSDPPGSGLHRDKETRE